MPNTIENAVAKVAGKAAAVDARFRGLKGVFTKLAEQHHEVNVLLLSAESATDVTKRRSLWETIRKQLLSHEQAELRELYPVLEAYPALRDIVRRHASEASELEMLIRRLDGIGVSADEWLPTLSQLKASVTAHAEEEERVFFPQSQQVIGEHASALLEQPFLQAKKTLMSTL